MGILYRPKQSLYALIMLLVNRSGLSLPTRNRGKVKPSIHISLTLVLYTEPNTTHHEYGVFLHFNEMLDSLPYTSPMN